MKWNRPIFKDSVSDSVIFNSSIVIAGLVALNVAGVFYNSPVASVREYIILLGVDLWTLAWAFKIVLDYKGRRTSLVLGYLLLCVFLSVASYANVYHSMVLHNPSTTFNNVKSLTGVDALYYSVNTFADYGTLSPISVLAKWLVISQMIVTFFLGTVVMSVFVSKLTSTRDASKRDENNLQLMNKLLSVNELLLRHVLSKDELHDIETQDDANQDDTNQSPLSSNPKNS